MRIIIAGDTVPTNSNMTLCEDADVRSLVGDELVEIFDKSDLAMVNLETPVIDGGQPIIKAGPNLSASVKSLNFLSRLGVGLVNLSNNHILDYGQEGLKSTIDSLKTLSIGYFGAGSDVRKADEGYTVELEKRITFYGVAEHEFSVANEYSGGANPFDKETIYNRISTMKKNVDYLIVLYHGGIEEYRYPSPELQDRCRKIADSGADLVICQHSHCVGCFEKYNDSEIVYGQGNFLFDRKNNEFWNSGLLIQIDLGQDGFEVSYLPVKKIKNVVRLAKGTEKNDILEQFFRRSEEILNVETVREKFDEYVDGRLGYYLYQLNGKKSVWKRIIRKLFGYKFILRRYDLDAIVHIYNILECESHSEVIRNALSNRIK